MTQNDHNWQKLSPFALIYFVVHFFFRFIKDGLLNLAPPFAVLLLQVENKLLWFGIGSVVFVLAVITYATLYYLFFKYKLTDNEVLLQRGIVKKQQLNLNFARIQNVNLSTPLYFSPFNLVNAQLDAAGSKGQEVVLAGIDRAKAENLRQEIFNYAKSNPEQKLEEEAEQAVERANFTLSNKEVAKFGLFSTTIFLLFAFAAPFQKHFSPVLKDQLILPLSTQLSSFIGNEKLLYLVATSAVFVGILALMLVVSVIAAMVKFFNFELLVEDGKIKRTCGLLERAQFSLQESKIQSVEVKQNWIARLLKRYTMSFKQINSASAGKAQKQQALVVPVLQQEQIQPLLEMCWNKFVDLPNLNYKGVSIRLFYKNCLLFVLLPITVATAISFNLIDATFFALAAAYTAVATFLCYMRYRRHGYAFIEGYVAVRKGLIGVSYKLLEPYKIQQISQRQTPMMAKHDLASLRFSMASGNITIPYMPQSLVLQQINTSVHLAQTTEKHWM